ncbi:sugar transferase [Gammaproteobacteria bacterium 53_120_T64]|nr:sugar transferase [Gammaproteobacteria bacterium 53_120_T64]
MHTHCHISPTTAYSKRLFDLFIATVGIIITLPLWPLIAVAIKYKSPGPIFFTQERSGISFANLAPTFKMIKFRTMIDNAEKNSGPVLATADDPRITSVGRFLRKTRLDELPQFINVLKGEMSVIGPRPERPAFYQKLEREIPFFSERTYCVTPGITGLSQVNQGYDTCLEDVRNKLGFDISYGLALSNFWSWLKMDCIIILRTLLVMFTARGQ